ncbi:protein shisa-4-like [Cyprinus carpio]|uniref:Protein shisa-4-like n=1 Tax=Cyprinus carpio TaxID=7962 RepID=A0A9Q9VNI9_CYPCA|nr:protein shisa-4-like [Cyprinus carpio]
MASSVPVLLLLSAVLFTATFADDDCKSYFSSAGELKPSIECSFLQFCCGTCDNRYCCSNPLRKLSEDDQDDCFLCSLCQKYWNVTFESRKTECWSILGFPTQSDSLCPQQPQIRGRKRPCVTAVMGATTTTVVTTQYPQQPVVQGGQYPPYQPMPPQAGYGGTPAYGGQPMQTGPYQGQPYAAGPPPPYQVAGGPGYPVPYSQGQYPMQPPVQPGFAHPPPSTDYSSTQPAYNPSYVEPPKPGY